MKHMKKLIIYYFILFSVFTAFIHAEPEYIYDEYGVLNTTEKEALEDLSATYSEQYDCGIYVRVLNTSEGYYVEDLAETVYTTEGLGKGNSDDGILLLIIMDERTYDIAVHGYHANEVFTNSKVDNIENSFLSYLSNGDYYTAFHTFIERSAYQLSSYNSNVESYDQSPYYDPYYEESMQRETTIKHVSIFVVPLLVSLIVCVVLCSKHKTKGRKFEASNYIPDHGFHLTMSRDIFLYRNEHRRRIEHDPPHHSGGGGSHHSSGGNGGFSHHSGKF